MIKFAHISLKDFIKKHNPQEPKKETIENFEKEINSLLENAPRQDDEEFQKNEINKFLKNAYGYDCNTNKKVDSAIYVDGEVRVLIEVKALNKKTEFPKNRENPLSKAFCQMVLYFLEEIEKEKNNSLKHTIICNVHEFFLFDCKDLLFLKKDKRIKKFYENYAKKEGTDSSKPKFYKDLEQYLQKDFQGELPYTHFNLSDDPKELPLIYQVLSHEVLLKQKKTLDANTLNKDFYEELLYILGLEEQNDKGKTLIKPSRTQNSLSDALKCSYNNLDDEEVMALLIAWNNRILFLRLLESLLISFEHFKNPFSTTENFNDKKPFLTTENFNDFNALNTLFFEVLAKKNSECLKEIKEDEILGKIPYLNSSLFDKTPLELKGYEIKLLDNKKLEIYKNSVLKKDNPKQEPLPLLEYLFVFLHAYDFTTTPEDIKDKIDTSESNLINPSVLGLVFEKLNGYKEGSFYTPSFITSYMCKESIKTIVLDKFNAIYQWDCKDLKALREKIDRDFSNEKAKEYLQDLLTLRICDPAVGSGHFLVSALNEMVWIAFKLGLITSLYRHSLRLENDEIIIHTPENKIFNYTIPHSENDPHHQIQKELFELKKSIIENCLFGVDINPNSCEITKLRLWIELLKYSYYIFEEGKNTNALETLPNIDINIKCGNSLISRFALKDKALLKTKKNQNLEYSIAEYKELVKIYKDPKILETITHPIKDSNAVRKYAKERLYQELKQNPNKDFKKALNDRIEKIKKAFKLTLDPPTNDHYDLSNMLVIKPLLIGVDTNLTVVGASGTIYTFYLFSTTYTSKFQSYFSVFVSNKRAIGKLNILSKNELEKREQEQLAQTETNTNSPNQQDKQKLDYRKIHYESKEIDDGKFIRIGDEVNHIFIEKAKINRGYLQKPKHKRTWWSLWLYKKPSDDALDIKALDVFDDGKYTYFRYDRDQAFSKFPYTYKVVDGYDNPINSRVVGNYIIAEDVSKKWTLRSGKEYVCVRRDKHKYQKSKDFMRLKRLLEQDEAMKAKRNNIHLIEDTTPQPKNAISITELLTQIKNQTPNEKCRALNEEEVKTLEEVKNIIKAPKPLQKDLKNKLKKHTIKTHYCVPIPYIERPKTTDGLENNKKGLNNTKKQHQANPIKEIKENKK